MLVFYLVLSLGVSFLCSLFEAVILSVSPAYVEGLAREGKPTGLLLQRLKNNLDDSLAAILTLNTIAHTVGAAGVGAEVQKQFGNEAVAIGSAILTLLVLVLSEIIPKTLGARYSRGFSGFAARGIRAFILISYPFVVSFKQLSKLIGGGSGHGGGFTRDEILFTAELGHAGGHLSEDEIRVIQNLLRLRDLRVKEILTPRTVVFTLEQSETVADVLTDHPTLPYSRIPIHSGRVDDVKSIVTRYDILRAHADGKHDVPLAELAKPLHAVPEVASISSALEQFVERRDHMFLVLDEFGGVAGVVTLEDAIEALLGIQIMDEFDSVADLREYAAREWHQRRAARERTDRRAKERADEEAQEQARNDASN